MYRYIIVDDEAIIRKGLVSKINEITSMDIGCGGEADNGVKGLELIEQTNPDIIITDMKMRKMDGMEFLDRISERYPDKPIIVISAHKAFSYVSKAIEKRAVGYVLKPFSTEEIEKQLRKAIDQIEQQRSILQLKETVATYEQKKEQDVLLEVILEPWNVNMEEKLLTKDFNTKDYYMLLTVNTMAEDGYFAMSAICSEYLNQVKYAVLDNPANKFQYFILMSVKEENMLHKMRTKAEHISMHLVKKLEGQKVFICIGEVFQGFAQLNRHYVLNDKMLRDIRLTDTYRILHRIEGRKEETVIYGEDYIKEIFIKMKYRNSKEKDILEEFFGGIWIDKHTLGDIGAACGKLIRKVNDYAVQKGVGTDDIMEVFYRRYLFCSSIEKMRKEISGYLVLIFNSIDMQDNAPDNLLETIQEYIKNNYHKKLTLQALSAELFVTPAFCSNLLKNRLNKSFNEYISEIRIDKAKRLLKETNLSVESISDEIGYSNSKYFFKIFKKMTHLSPNEYRNGRPQHTVNAGCHTNRRN